MRLGIATKINLFVGVLIILPIVFLGWFFIRHETGAIEKELTLRAESTVKNLALNSEMGILVRDEGELTRLLEAVLKGKDFVHAVVESSEGRVLARAGIQNGGPVKEFSAPVITMLQSREDAILEDTLPGDAGQTQEIIGRVTLTVSLAELNQKTAQLKKIIVVVLAGVMLLSIIGALFGIKFLIIKPLSDLVAGIETIGHGDLSHRVEVKSKDEIGTLADSFNMMTENLSKVLVSKNYVDNILESMNDILLVFSLEGTIKTVNRATLHLLGYEETELTGQSFETVMPGEDVLFNPSKMLDLMNKEIIYSSEEKELLKKDRTPLQVSFSATFMYDSARQIQGIICVAQDITERKRAEKEKQELEMKLQVAEKMEALGRLAGGVAHDLNNTLGAIVGYPDLLLKKLPDDFPQRKALEAIKKSGQKAAAIVRDLLTLARRSIPIKETMNVNHLVEEFLHSAEWEKLKSLYPDVRIDTQPDNDLFNIKGSPVHLSKTIMNLVTNAAESIEDDGSIIISTANRYIEKEIKGEEMGLRIGEYVLLTVSDTGAGIDPEDLKRIFEPFFTRKKMGRSGTGLGMAVVWGTVKDHDGYVDIRSAPGEGSTVELYFPATREELEPGKEIVVMDEYKGNGEKILVVDDMPEQREISSRLLLDLGYTVRAVSGGEEAIRYLADNLVDLVILDMIMDPGIDGLDTFKKIRELYPDTKAIIASGYSETERVKEAQRHGAGAYIQKPYTLERIAMAVKTELRRK
jgi:PAS domain S-box-containing protein